MSKIFKEIVRKLKQKSNLKALISVFKNFQIIILGTFPKKAVEKDGRFATIKKGKRGSIIFIRFPSIIDAH